MAGPSVCRVHSHARDHKVSLPSCPTAPTSRLHELSVEGVRGVQPQLDAYHLGWAAVARPSSHQPVSRGARIFDPGSHFPILSLDRCNDHLRRGVQLCVLHAREHRASDNKRVRGLLFRTNQPWYPDPSVRNLLASPVHLEVTRLRNVQAVVKRKFLNHVHQLLSRLPRGGLNTEYAVLQEVLIGPWELGVDPHCRQRLRVPRSKHLHERSSRGADEHEEGLGNCLPGRERDERSGVVSKVGFRHEGPLAPPFSQAEPCSRKE
eukprot:1187917-Prorocentrum_minimum.AAC.1